MAKKLLVIHGSGMTMRGKVQTEIFGRMTPPEYDAAIINLDGFARGYPALVIALSRVSFPTIEVHISNPARRGTQSEVAAASRGTVTGFGVIGYELAMRGLREILGG